MTSCSWGMAVLFALATVVQFNDPDPVKWIAVYAAACALSVTNAIRCRVPRVWTALLGLVALAWALAIVFGGPGAGAYRQMFDAWEMRSLDVEEAREATGLLIVAAWTAALAMRARRRTSPVVS